MKGWAKQTTLLRNAQSTSERIDILREWANEFSSSKLSKYMDESFRTLNNPNRYKYYMQADTVTHEKYLTFLVCLDIICRRDEVDDYLGYAVNSLKLNSSKSWMTLYYVFSLFKVHRRKFEDLDINAKKDDISDLLVNARNGGYEFKDCNYYDYMDIIKECLDAKTEGGIFKKDKGRRNYSEILEENRSLKEELKKVKKKLKQPKVNW